MFATSKILLICFGIVLVTGLDLDKVKEGSCNSLNTTPATDINMEWLTSHTQSGKHWYIAAGNKYHLYWMTLVLFHNKGDILANIPEYKFYYDAQLKSNVSLSLEEGTASLIGYDKLAHFHFERLSHGVYDFSSANPEIRKSGNATSRHHVTLTDNQSFVFFTNCNIGNDEKSWDVISVTESPSPDVIRQIEEHAESQGFDKRHFVMLRHNICS